MGVAEYVLVFISLVLGLAMADILVSVHRLLRARRRVRWDWAAPAGTLLVALLLLMLWWSQFPDDRERSLTLGAFLPMFLELVLLFLLAAAALPDDVPPEGLSLRAYYEENAPYFWTLMSLALAWATAIEAMDVGGPRELLAFLAQRVVDLVVLALFVSLVFVRRRWWHAVVLGVALLGPIAWLSRTIG